MDSVGLNTVPKEKVYNKLEVSRELVHMVSEFFSDPNVNSLSKIIAQDIKIDSIIDENIKMIDKFAAENKTMQLDDSSVEDLVNKVKRKMSLVTSSLSVDFNHNKFDLKIAKLSA